MMPIEMKRTCLAEGDVPAARPSCRDAAGMGQDSRSQSATHNRCPAPAGRTVGHGCMGCMDMMMAGLNSWLQLLDVSGAVKQQP